MEQEVVGATPTSCTKTMNKKTSKPSVDLPGGFIDRKEKELVIRDFLVKQIKEVMTKYGFEFLETPSFEYTESLGKFLPDKDRPSEGVFSFEDGKKWLSLRYDLTAPLARFTAKNFDNLSRPFKRYQLGTVWRNEKPGPGRFREFLQFDADYVGTNNLLSDAELCELISEILEKCGLANNEFNIKISNRKLSKGLLEELNIKDENQQAVSLRAIDKLDRVGIDGVKLLLGKGRKDKSGDFTEGAKLEAKQIDKIVEFLNSKGIDQLEQIGCKNKLFQEGIGELKQIVKNFEFFEFNNLHHEHISYGTLNDSDGNPFKTRDGGTKPLSELFEETYEYIKNINSALEDSTIKQLANSVLTFSDLITNRKTDYKFDLEKFTNVNGKTGIYVQYAQVRAKRLQQSISQQKNEMESLILSDVDKQLLSQLFMFGYFLEQSSLLNEPHHLANYLYDISNSFNQFYEHEKLSEIKDINHLSSKLYLINLFLTTSENVMFCLGMKPVEKM